MIRRFIQCKNTKERLELMAASKEQEWAESELDTVMEILGMKVQGNNSKEGKWAMIMLFLTNKAAVVGKDLSQKLFKDVEEGKSHSEEELERLSDLSAYIKVCHENEVIR